MKYDYLIVGSGLFGACFAYFATLRGCRVLVIDKRNHTGGNIYCETMQGINVHKYGAHIFHTSDKDVWDFVNSIVPFNRYTNSPVAFAPDGNLYNLPFNMNTFYQLWGVRTPEEALAKIDEQRRDAFDKMKEEGVLEPRNLEEQALTLIGRDIYELLIRNYTEKQWGRPCNELPAFIIRRLPVRFTFDNNYFNSLYQGVPVGGYNRLIDGLLKNSEVLTEVDFSTIKHRWKDIANKLVYTGAIDEYFDYKFGYLDWRTVRFETEILNIPNFQGNAVVNYTDKHNPWTRIIEHKHFEDFGASVYENPVTIISKEYSFEWKPGIEPFYPINDDKNISILTRYQECANQQYNVIFGGRLAEYKYYDMDIIIKKVMNHPELTDK